MPANPSRQARRLFVAALGTMILFAASVSGAQDTVKPVLHGKHWVAVTGKPLAATAGAMMFARG
ncbi:MAG: hypothetical protein WD078_11810, partial [Woeseia sp.]